MATYKLIQNIEAEDKILGPLTLRQFIFALVAAFFGYLCFIAAAKEAFFLLILFAPPMLLAGFFAFPFGRDQPTEVWALAKLRFWFKPRRRMWDQSGVKELVTITVPKKVERVYTDGLSQIEVQSRLKALANTIDSRGWAVKNVNITDYAPDPITVASSDRLLDISSVPEAVPDTIVQASDDMLDEQNNPVARQFNTMIAESSQIYRERLVAHMNDTVTPQPFSPVATASPAWFFVGGSSASVTTPAVAAAADDAALSAQIHQKASSRRASYGNLRTLKPLGPRQPSIKATPAAPNSSVPQQPTAEVTAPPHPAILALANNDDFNVSTLAREAQKAKGNGLENGEVVISLQHA